MKTHLHFNLFTNLLTSLTSSISTPKKNQLEVVGCSNLLCKWEHGFFLARERKFRLGPWTKLRERSHDSDIFEVHCWTLDLEIANPLGAEKCCHQNRYKWTKKWWWVMLSVSLMSEFWNGQTSKLKAFVHHKRVMFSLQLARDIT